MKKVSKSTSETAQLAGEWLVALAGQKNKQATIVLLSGDLGSGKTTFTQAVAGALGVKSRVTSPTFVLQKRYQLPKGSTLKSQKGATFWPWQKLIHMDCYRLAGGQEVANIGWSEIVADPANLILVEWPDMIASALPELSEKIHFKFIDETTRTLDFKPWPKTKKK
jgi:tRNA threonylcarbamoyladenosine biosynthesis protein TsaE